MIPYSGSLLDLIRFLACVIWTEIAQRFNQLRHRLRALAWRLRK